MMEINMKVSEKWKTKYSMTQLYDCWPLHKDSISVHEVLAYSCVWLGYPQKQWKWNQWHYPSTDEWILKMWLIYKKIKFYSAIKTPPCYMQEKSIYLESITLRKVIYTQKGMFSHIWILTFLIFNVFLFAFATFLSILFPHFLWFLFSASSTIVINSTY